MIPYFQQPSLPLGPVSIHAFGVLVAIGILLGIRLIRRRAVATGLDAAQAERMTMRVVIGAFLISHIFDRLTYFPRETLENPLTLLKFYDGISSFGGFLGATLMTLFYIRRWSDPVERWRYMDLIAYALPTGWFFGRMGCFVAYDHPGRETTFFLGQQYSDHVVRHNLGLYEALFTLPLALAYLWLGRRGRQLRPGLLVALLPIVYAPVRFLFDVLRTGDARYFGLTPGQYSAIGFLILGIFVLIRTKSLAAPAAK
jgi:phosphatidylglycerol:prolipoprotein diacylglycerol transferase